MNSVLFDGSQHYLKLASGQVVGLRGVVGKLPAHATQVKNYAPGRFAQLLVANLERGAFSVPVGLRATLQALANSAPPSAHLQLESEIIMASPKSTAAKKTATKPTAAKQAAAKTSAKKAAAKTPAKKAAAKTPAEKAVVAAPATSGKGRAPAQADSRTITVLAESNPKRGLSAARFALYATGMTVGAYIAEGGKRADISHDIGAGFISVA